MTSSKSIPIQLPLPLEGQTIDIPLKQGYVAVVDAIDADLLQWSWGIRIAPPKWVYATRPVRENGERHCIRMHRMIMSRVLGRNLERWEFVDHHDLNSLNNQRSNLRLATPSQNRTNSKGNAESGLKGAYYNKANSSWFSSLTYRGKRIHLGMFETAEEAHQAYCNLAAKLFGEFARFE